MTLTIAAFGFPAWLRAAHLINLFFIGYLVRSGIQILGAYPRLYWNENSRPGSEWILFTRKKLPKDRPWTALEQEAEVPAVLGQPGGNNLGLGRHWHFFSVVFWILNGVVYVILLFATGEWQRLIPTSWSIIPDAWRTFIYYASFQLPPASFFHPYDPLQQLAYAAVVFLLGPFIILTGAAQSPAVEARFPWYVNAFGGRQFARSLHFLALLAVVLFTIVHTAMVIITGLPKNLGDIVLGTEARSSQNLAVVIAICVVIAILAIYALTSALSRLAPVQTKNTLAPIFLAVLRPLSLWSRSHQQYKPEQISAYFPLNGEPPRSPDYLQLLWNDFSDWRLEVKGLVKRPQTFSLAELHALPKQTQITKHNCIQGWSAIGKWGGVPMRELLARCEPLPTARYVVFHSYSRDQAGKEFYETLSLPLMRHSQTILAYEMNDEALPMQHGAPLRLRVETQLGFKMVKWLSAIEFVEDYHNIREGQGGSREDNMYYEQIASA
ncbi:MAG: molybdopterin-dependent oxidoreductase [Ktedonobacterales bacterium]